MGERFGKYTFENVKRLTGVDFSKTVPDFFLMQMLTPFFKYDTQKAAQKARKFPYFLLPYEGSLYQGDEVQASRFIAMGVRNIFIQQIQEALKGRSGPVKNLAEMKKILNMLPDAQSMQRILDKDPQIKSHPEYSKMAQELTQSYDMTRRRTFMVIEKSIAINREKGKSVTPHLVQP